MVNYLLHSLNLSTLCCLAFIIIIDCEKGTCKHQRAVNWVECSRCNKWLHCICALVRCQKAKNKSFAFVCKQCYIIL